MTKGLYVHHQLANTIYLPGSTQTLSKITHNPFTVNWTQTWQQQTGGFGGGGQTTVTPSGLLKGLKRAISKQPEETWQKLPFVRKRLFLISSTTSNCSLISCAHWTKMKLIATNCEEGAVRLVPIWGRAIYMDVSSIPSSLNVKQWKGRINRAYWMNVLAPTSFKKRKHLKRVFFILHKAVFNLILHL